MHLTIRSTLFKPMHTQDLICHWGKDEAAMLTNVPFTPLSVKRSVVKGFIPSATLVVIL